MMRKFLSWFQERIKSWIKPATPVLIIDLLSDLTQSRRVELILENALLRQQLIILKRQVKRLS
jgi:putative transposase